MEEGSQQVKFCQSSLCEIKEAQPLSNFYNDKTKLDGKSGICKVCAKKAHKLWRSNPEVAANYKTYNNQYLKNKRETDSSHRLEVNIKSRTHHGLRNSETRKSVSNVYLLGCSYKQLRVYLESLFTEGMSWDNYGKGGWEVDHIKPCASFDLSDLKQQRICFHYTNLQPLWRIDNRKKSDKFKEEVCDENR